ncbi:Plasma membrane sulfite pump involved in sulfite metabolism [Cryptotrichosporon argae]
MDPSGAGPASPAVGVDQLAPCDSATSARSSTLPSSSPSRGPPREPGSRSARFLLHLSPAYFTTTMGTGIVSILLHQFPYPARWLQYLGTAVFALNVALFAALAVLSVMRYLVWRGVWTAVLHHNVSSAFWGTAPMGLVTIVNMVALVCVPAWGRPAALLALGLWWIAIVSSIVVNFGVLFLMVARQTHSPSSIGAHWLLPIVTSVVASSSGAVVAAALAPFSPSLARAVVLVSYIVWGTGVPTACLVIGIWLARTAVLGPPAPAALASMLFPLGPCGQGAYGILGLGAAARILEHAHATPLVPGLALADAVYAGGVVAALVLWGFGLVWYTLAHAIMIDHALRTRARFLRPAEFTIGLWGLTFPIGVFATATISLAAALDSTALRVIAAFLAAQVTANWLHVAAMTVYKVWQGTLVVAPELGDEVWETRWAPRVRGRRVAARGRARRRAGAGEAEKSTSTARAADVETGEV